MHSLMPTLDDASNVPVYMQLYAYIKAQISAGQLRPGEKLPSVRLLASLLGRSRTPIAHAYDQLAAEGYAVSRPRSGLFVADLSIHSPEITGSPGIDPIDKSASKPLATDGPPIPSRAYHAANADEADYDFGYGAVDLSQFPHGKWRKLVGECFLPENGRTLLYGDYQGDPRLREEIAAYLLHARGVRSLPGQIVVGAGTYHSLALLLQLLRPRLGAIAAEEAVNDGVKSLLLQAGAPVKPISLEADGIRMDELRASSAQAVYLTPSHQFPYGMTTSIAKRLQLLAWAQARDAYIIENDYDGEFRYGGKPIPSLQGLDADGRVIYLGTFSKALAPSLRISYLVLPPELLSAFKAMAHSYDQLASPIFQAALARFMRAGDFERHIRRMRMLYNRKQETMLAAVREHLGDRVDVIGQGSGLHLLLRDRCGRREEELVTAARAARVHVYPTSIYALAPELAAPGTVLLGYGGIPIERIASGIRRLSEAWEV
ncbi:PLP-dependent aminotransferase family protein [Paenibacillus methanolicus]|uniref:GntR family transcriptional regulator/MocR family aminotransferase n=1 Tax=Paenibacillus methanolicus TaxID=582686 RepID=A0A5S5BS03_9BACL|nr:PLP-dependent aminotransferase family protein [Paenibacillus methanolicus]TYP69777.1 GntR family transcriptional regulator/MocR family aminotransferase [Paenibacillus methanolicus]